MSVIGIDFGNESCYVAAAKDGGIETLDNDYSLRATPSYVAFDGKKRIIGVAAKNQQVTNMKNTVSGFKRLLGRKYNDPHVQHELDKITAKVEERGDGGIAVKVNYLDQDQYLSPEQLTAMLFTKLKETSSTALHAQVNDCVITCPVYFTNAERRALLDAAQIAGLHVLRLMNETTATALSFGFYRQDLSEDKPRTVVFVDCGNSALQVSACAFTKGKLKMLASSCEQVGGRDFDYILADHFAKEFQDRYKINVMSNTRTYLRLLTEIEKLKKQMSANSTKLPLNIECFMNDIDVSSSMQRADMEQLCAHLLLRVENTFKRFLQESNLSLSEIHSVEIVGGSTRIPAIKHLIENIFGKPASTTLNQDESVSRGAALQCAIMSPAVRVREFSVTDIQKYAVKIAWDTEGEVSGSEIEIFPVFHPAPFSRLLTLNRKEPFCLKLMYAQEVPYPDRLIGKWFIKNVKATEKGDNQEIKVKVRINQHGILLISSAVYVDKKEIEDAQASGEHLTRASEKNDEMANASDTTARESIFSPQDAGEKKKKVSKLIELPIEIHTHGLSYFDLDNLMKQEAKMIGHDAKERERVDAKNALEEFVYDTRNKIQGGQLESYISNSDRDGICGQLTKIENWLYEDGEDCDREIYIEKLQNLHIKTDEIQERASNFTSCPGLFDDLKHAINFARGNIMEFKKGTPKFEHLTEAEFFNISIAADRAQKWLDINFSKFTQAPRTANSPVTSSEIRYELDILISCVNKVIHRPKPLPHISSKQDHDGMNKEKEDGGKPVLNEKKSDITMDID